MPTKSRPNKAANLLEIELSKALCKVTSYPHLDDSLTVMMHETHISWVFLVGDFAYTVKKPITTSFLDYGTLQQRLKYCNEELRYVNSLLICFALI